MSRKIVDQAIYDAEVSKTNKMIIRDFLIEKKSEGKATGTIKQYGYDLKIIAYIIYKEFDNKSFVELTRKDIRNISMFFQERVLPNGRKLSNARVNRLLSSLRSTLEFCSDDDDYDYEFNIGSRVKGLPRHPVREIIFLNDEQINWLKDELIKRKDWIKAVYLMLSYISAARKNEVHQVQKEQLTERFFTNKVTGKGGKEFRLFYVPEVQALIKKYMEYRGEDEIPGLFVRVFKNGDKQAYSSDAFNDWCDYFSRLLSMKEGKNVHINPHCFRHSRLENLSRSGVPVEKLKTLAHHEDISTTASYLADREEDDIAEIFGMDKSNFAV
jgi:integrase/recombinase XerD